MASNGTTQQGSPAPQSPTDDAKIASALDRAKRAFALKKYEEAVDHYGVALDIATTKYGEASPETADMYFSYGMALLENAVAQNMVLGKEQPQDAEPDAEGSSSTGIGHAPILSFSGDGDDAEDGSGEEQTVDLFGQNGGMDAAGDESGDEDDKEESDEDYEPQDDFSAAWEVLDLARVLYEKQIPTAEDNDVKLKLANTYVALGDISLETEKFDQAITDYETALRLKQDILPSSSRHIAEAHYKLSIVLDMTSGRLADAIMHAEEALASVESLLAQLRDGLSGQMPLATAADEDGTSGSDAKGKGKGNGKAMVDESVTNLTKDQKEKEIKELISLRDDLALKVEELKTSPNEPPEMNAPAMAARALDDELNARLAAGSSSISKPTVVNDLTSMMRRKRKAPGETPSTKKTRVDGEP